VASARRRSLLQAATTGVMGTYFVASSDPNATLTALKLVSRLSPWV
jgi:hypothetical protein